MKQAESRKRVQELFREHEKLITRKNVKAKSGSGVYDRYANPVLTAEHTPWFWRYAFEYESNPHLMERIGVNAAFNAGAMEYAGACAPGRSGQEIVSRGSGKPERRGQLSIFAITQS
jgi:4-O-beta-D-mannosyl-D-glucose phosphorylase